MLADGLIVPYASPEVKWIYTKGIRLSAVRKLMRTDSLSH
jgi:hypothetical protein